MKPVQIALAVAMALCLCDMPYGYYKLVRFVSMIVFGIMAFVYACEYNEGGKYKDIAIWLAVASGVFALTFQPIVKIRLDRETWNFLDVVAGLFLVGIILWEKNRKAKEEEK